MQMLGRYDVQYYNYSDRRTGTLWEGRYKAAPIDTETYLLTCMRSIEFNPVRPGMAEHPSQYPWSSYHHTALGQPNALLTPYSEYQRLGKTDEERQAAYRQLFKPHIAEHSLTEIRKQLTKPVTPLMLFEASVDVSIAASTPRKFARVSQTVRRPK